MKRLQRDLSSGDNKVSHESAVSRQEKKPPKNGRLVWACGLLDGRWPETGFGDMCRSRISRIPRWTRTSPASTCLSAAILSASLSLPRACSSLPPKYEIILRCVRIWGSRSEAIPTPADGTFAQDPSRVPRLQYHRQGFDAIVSFIPIG
jgi:hypothetical protein